VCVYPFTIMYRTIPVPMSIEISYTSCACLFLIHTFDISVDIRTFVLLGMENPGTNKKSLPFPYNSSI